jgi:hypothetical protein
MLPNAHLAVIEPSKIRDYLLSPSHPIEQNPAVAGQASPYGQKFEVGGKLI